MNQPDWSGGCEINAGQRRSDAGPVLIDQATAINSFADQLSACRIGGKPRQNHLADDATNPASLRS